jgi:hypothetical protein
MRTWILAIAATLLILPATASARGGAKLSRCLERCETNCVERCDVHHLPKTGANRDCRAKCERKEHRCVERCNYKFKPR